MLRWLRSLTNRKSVPPLSEWFHVAWDSRSVNLDVHPPDSQQWRASFEWSDVTRVCFKAEDPWMSDGIYVFVSGRAESYAIPIEADGGARFWDEILNRGLFDSDLATDAIRAVEGVFCWPPTDEEVIV